MPSPPILIIKSDSILFNSFESDSTSITGYFKLFFLTVLKISSDDAEKLRGIITNKIRKISKVQSTLTMMVIEEQENL